MPAIRATFHRVSVRTKTPFLARINSSGGSCPEPFVIFVTSLETSYPGHPFFRAAIVSGPKTDYPDLQPGAAMTVSCFSGISRMELAGIPKSDSREISLPD